MDAITLLKNDHQTVEELFKSFERAGDGARSQKRKIVDRIIRELAVHASIEEQVFYPAVRLAVAKTEDTVLESLEEHHIVKWILSELEKMDPAEERFDAKVTVLIENVRHHVTEEESELFPQVRKALSRSDLDEIGERLQAAKRAAPTHPHPRSPDTPPGNLIAGVVAATTDLARDTIRATGRGVVEAMRSAAADGRDSAKTAATNGRKALKGAASDGRRAARGAASNGRRTVTNARADGRRVAKTVKSDATHAARTVATDGRRAARSVAAESNDAARGVASDGRDAAKAVAKTAKGTRSTRTRTAARSTARATARTASRPAKKAASGTRSSARKATTPRRATAKRS